MEKVKYVILIIYYICCMGLSYLKLIVLRDEVYVNVRFGNVR